MRPLHGRLWLVAVLFAFLTAAPLTAQPTADPLAADVDAALAALAREAPEEAIDYLEAVVAAEPAYVAPSLEGAAAYWLGHAYEAAGYPNEAHDVWLEGNLALHAQGLFDVKLADAFVWSTYEGGREADYRHAADVYLQLLAALDAHDTEVATVLAPHLQALRIVVPSALQEQIGLDDWQPEQPEALAPEAGTTLATWWRSQDVAPATRKNERLEEHLARVVYAREHYAFDDGLDERAHVYIRLGEPARQTHVPFDRTFFRNKVLDRSLTLNESDFYANEFWYYEHIGYDAHFLFYNKKGYFELGSVRDLLPPAISNGVGATERGRSKAEAVVRTLEEIYRQLAIYHDDFATRYQDVAAFSSLLDDQETVEAAEQWKQTRQEGFQQGGSAQDKVSQRLAERGTASASMPGSAFSADQPHLYVHHALQVSQTEDNLIAVRREENVPPTYTNIFDDAAPLQAMGRVARFLDPDGTTRTELYWGTPPGALWPSRAVRKRLRREELPTDDYLLIATVVQKDAAYRERIVNVHRHLVTDLDRDPEAAIAPKTYVLQGDTGTYHIALQWDQYVAALGPDGMPSNIDERVQANTFRADTLHALTADEQVLEMSDLKPLVLSSEPAGTVDEMLTEATVYPATEIPADANLALYFELYHLPFGAGDQTAYEVEYEIRRAGRGLLGQSEPVLTSSATRYTGDRRTAREYILVDLSETKAGDAIDITVRVTDQTSGQQIERSVAFEVVKP